MEKEKSLSEERWFLFNFMRDRLLRGERFKLLDLEGLFSSIRAFESEAVKRLKESLEPMSITNGKDNKSWYVIKMSKINEIFGEDLT